jgi:transposase
MHHRHAIRDEDWDRIKDLLPGRAGQPGVTAKDNRLFVNAVLWIAKTGAPWRDLPERFGHWNSVWKRFDRWARKGLWRKIFKQLQDPHPHAAGAKKKATGPGDSSSKRWAAVAAVSEPRSTRP